MKPYGVGPKDKDKFPKHSGNEVKAVTRYHAQKPRKHRARRWAREDILAQLKEGMA